MSTNKQPDIHVGNEHGDACDAETFNRGATSRDQINDALNHRRGIYNGRKATYSPDRAKPWRDITTERK